MVVEVCGGESELGGAIYSRPEAVAMNGISPAMVTAAQCLVGVLRGLGINVEVYEFHLEANPCWIWRARLVSTERGGTGPSAAGSVLCACRAMATVLHACAGKEVATRSH